MSPRPDTGTPKPVERLNGQIRRAVAMFTTLGVPAEIPLPGDVESKRRLRFGKYGATWGIYVLYGEGDPVDLLNANKLTRLQAVPWVPDLYEALLRVSAGTDHAVEVAAARLQTYLDEWDVVHERTGRTGRGGDE